MSALFALVLLAQAQQGYWVDLDICQISRDNIASKSQSGVLSLFISRDRPAIVEIIPKPTGIDCVRIIYRGDSTFVVGTREEVRRKLDGR